MRCDKIWRNARLATLSGADLGIVERGLLACSNGKILYAGPESEAPELESREEIDCDGRWITPGLVDCHTHLVFAGDRAAEFEARLNGATYEEIARAGGGIISTVRATRAASEETLVSQALPRLDALIGEGATTIEIKSGYGLNLADETKQLHAARTLGEQRKIDIATTFLGAHALPPEEKDKQTYIDKLCREMIPAIAEQRLACAVDGFCEAIGFSPAQTAQVFEAARVHGLSVKLHADQLSDTGGALLAARYGALSADHLEHTDEAGIEAMAQARVTAVLLPGAYYFLRETKLPPVDLLRKHGVPIAIATDCNPGTSPLTSLLLTMNLAATLFRLTVQECIAGVTREAARALGRLAKIGSLEPGKQCDLAIWNIEHPAELVYRIGFNPLHTRIWRGM
jgi:imidazolonepropionase